MQRFLARIIRLRHDVVVERWLLVAVLTVAGFLRLEGISWGLQRGYHPDEVVSMRGVVQLDPLAGDFTAPAAYFEGTFNYYLWSLPVAAASLLDTAGRKPWHPKFETMLDESHFGWILFVSRLMTAGFGTATVLAVFLAAREAVGVFYPALVGASLYAIIPVDVIYSHFMRPHVLANLLATLVLWFSFKLLQNQKKIVLLSAGLLTGLAAATRYPVGVIVLVPCLCSMLAFAQSTPCPGSRFLKSIRSFLSGPIWWIALGFLSGLFVGEPMIVLNFREVIAGFTKDSLRFIPVEQFSGARLIDFTVVWKYVAVLVPYGMCPFLWAIPYAAILYLLTSRRMLRITLPILIFSISYLYPMAKGYSSGLFARAAMPLFPGFCILASVACHAMFYQSRLRPSARGVVAFVIGCLALPSLAFDLAYVHGMKAADPRMALQSDLTNCFRTAAIKLGIDKSGGDFYTLFPVLRKLDKSRVSFKSQRPDEPGDGYILSLRTPNIPENRKRLIHHVEARTNFRFVKKYGVTPRFLWYRPNLWSFPPDMTYPFFEILAFWSTDAVPFAPASPEKSQGSDE